MAGPQNRDKASLKHPQFGRPIGKMISDISCLQELSIPVADHTSRRMNSLSTNSLIFVHWLGYDTNFGIVPVSRFHILQKKSSQVQSV